MTDRELAAAAWAELAQTSITYPKWKGQGFTAGHWANAKALLDQVGVAAPVKSGPWMWDATAATVSPSSSLLVSRVSVPAANAAYFAATVAHVFSPGGTPGYQIPAGQWSGLDQKVPVPIGTQPGPTSDRHLYILDASGREHDLWTANYDPATRRIVSAGGGVSFPADAVCEPGPPGDATAARFPLSRGLITPADIRSGVIDHPLVIAIPLTAVADKPCVYPANTTFNDATVPYGQWYRLDPFVDVTSLGLDALNQMICRALQRYGAFVRDESGSGNNTVAVFGTDEVNQGGNAGWPVPLLIKNAAGYPYATRLGGIPWGRLQALNPPPH